MTRALLTAIFTVVLTCAALAERRVALVMGADGYDTIRPLENAVADALAMRTALEALDFEVFLEPDRDLRRMRRALEDFVHDAKGADVALVFFAGHGVEIAGENRLLPVDADAGTMDALMSSSLPLEEVQEAVARIAPIGLILLDACRNDPFAASSEEDGRGASALSAPALPGVTPGLGRMGRSENVLYAFAAAPGETASDGGENSPFTAALTKYLATEGLEIRSVLTLVQQEVYDLSSGKQLPYVESGLPKTFFAASSGEELPERERLLLAMADVTPAIRDEIERIAARHEMPLAPLYGTLVSADLGALAVGDRENKLGEAARAYVETQRRLRALSSIDPQVARLRSEAEDKLALGAFNEARARLGEAAEIDALSADALAANLVARRISEAETHAADAGVARAQLDYDSAVAALERATALHERIEREAVPDKARRTYIWLLADLGDIHELTGDTPAALETFRRMHSAAQALVARSPTLIYAAFDLSASYERLGNVLVRQQDFAAAREAFGKSLEISEAAARQLPDDPAVQYYLATINARLSKVAFIDEDYEVSLELLNVSREITLKLAAADPNNLDYRRDLSVISIGIGDALLAQGDIAGALNANQSAFHIMQELADQYPENLELRRELAVSHIELGNVHAALGDFDEALASYRAGLGIVKQITELDPLNSEWKRDLAIGYSKVGDALRKQGETSDARAAYEARHHVIEMLVARDPQNTQWQTDLMRSHHDLSEFGEDRRIHLEQALALGDAIGRRGLLKPGEADALESIRSELAGLDAE